MSRGSEVERKFGMRTKSEPSPSLPFALRMDHVKTGAHGVDPGRDSWNQHDILGAEIALVGQTNIMAERSPLPWQTMSRRTIFRAR